jgi:hypothetical protein
VEDFNTEFAECFETPSRLRGIVTEISNQVEECDRTLSYMVKYDCERKSTYDVLNHTNGCDDYNNDTENYGLDALNNVREFFASYECEGDTVENPLEWSSLGLEEEAEEDDDFEKL